MCTYVTSTVAVCGSAGIGDDRWFAADRAVLSFDHPQDALLEHALCIDVWGAGGERVALELDAASARRLAEGILELLTNREVDVLL